MQSNLNLETYVPAFPNLFYPSWVSILCSFPGVKDYFVWQRQLDWLGWDWTQVGIGLIHGHRLEMLHYYIVTSCKKIGHRLVLDPLPTFGNVTSCKRTKYFQYKRCGLKTHLWHKCGWNLTAFIARKTFGKWCFLWSTEDRWVSTGVKPALGSFANI